MTRASYRKVVRRLAEVEQEYVLKLSDATQATFKAREAEIEGMVGDGGQLELMRDWGAKLAGATLRLAAVMHGVKGGLSQAIEEGTIAAAAEIARYLIPHAESVLNMMQANEDSTLADAKYVLRWIERYGRRTSTKRDFQQHGRRRFEKADDIDPALNELTRRGYIRPRSTKPGGRGRPASPSFEVNPATLSSSEPERCTHNSQKSGSELQVSDSGNIGNTPGDLQKTAHASMGQTDTATSPPADHEDHRTEDDATALVPEISDDDWGEV